MTKQEYMEKLQEKLENFGQELQEEILEDYRQHFAEGEKQGKSDEEIIEELGNIEDMIQDLSEVDIQGNSREEQQEEHKRTKIGIQLEIGKEFNWNKTDKSYDYPGKYKAVEVNGEVADITVTPSDDDRIHVRCRETGSIANQQAYEYYQYEENGTFYVGVKGKKNAEGKKRVTVLGHTIFAYGDMFSFCQREPHMALDVAIPAGIPMAKVSTSSGDAHISGLCLETLHTSTASGDFTIAGVTADEMKMNTASGDIHVSEGKAENLKLNAASGDITMEKITLGSGNLNSASGVILVKDSRIEKVKCNTASGDIVISSVSKECGCRAASGDITVNCRGTQEKLVLGTASGDIELRMEESEGIEVTVKTCSGDADIMWNGERHSVRKGIYTYGNGACKAVLSTGSGDITVIGNQ